MSQITGQVNPIFWDMHSSSLDKKVADFLRQRRGNLTYREFAPVLGMTRSTLHRLENLEQSITLAKLDALAKRLRTTAEEVLGVPKDPK